MHCNLVSAGHWQCRATTNKPAPTTDTPHGSPDTSMLSAELQQQWDVERNMHLGAIRVKPNSGTKAVWQCNKCPMGQPHIWTAEVRRRVRGTQCPYCRNKRVCLHNSLATIAPDVARCWNYSKNQTMPEQVVAGSNAKAEWKCPACNLEWQAPISGRTRKRSGCPKCSRANQVIQSRPTFLEAQHAFLAEWDYERNGANDIYPDSITLGSHKLVHWVCSCCPREQPHRWTARPNDRIGHGSGCAVCAGQQACVCNSLLSLFPLIAVEFDVDKNGFAPSAITAQSHQEVWWRNAKRGSWRQAVHRRTDRRNELFNQQV